MKAMDFELSEEQQQLRRTVRDFAEKELAPHSREWDEKQAFPREVFARLGETGLAGCCWPEEYGGSGLSTLDWALRMTFMVVTPAAVGLLMLSGPLMATIFGYGEFGAYDVRMSSYALMAYSVGLIGFSMVKVLAPGYFARQDTRTPVKVGMIALAVNIGFNLSVVVPAYLAGFPAPHALLALSTGMSAFVNSGLLYRGLRRDGVYAPSHRWRRLVPQVLAANTAMAAFLWWAAGDWAAWPEMALARRLVTLVVCVAGGGALYFLTLFVLGARHGDFRGAKSR